MTMVANKLTPFYPIHPGEILKDEVEYRKISQRALARQMGISYSQLNEVLNGKRPVNTELALLLKQLWGLILKCCSICRRDIICRWRVPISARKNAGMKYVSCVHRSFDAHNCIICYQKIYSTYSTNPFRYSPSGW